MDRVEQRAVINDKLVVFDFIEGDLIETKEDGIRGVITKVENPFVYVNWCDDIAKENRGTRWMVDSVRRVE